MIDNALDAGFFAQDLDLPDELLRRAEARQVVRKQSDFKTLPDATRQLFPAAFEESTEPSLGLGGWVPKGWQVSTTGDEFTVKGGSTPSTANPDFWDGGHIHWTSPKDLLDYHRDSASFSNRCGIGAVRIPALAKSVTIHSRLNR